MRCIDYRSDTVTRPTEGMKKYMMNAPVGDDVFGEDPSVNKLEHMMAERFDKEAALFCPSGTMCNQIAIKLHTDPLDEIICEINSHVYQYESAGYAFHSNVGIKALKGNNGQLHSDLINDAVRPHDIHFPKSSLISLENTCNKAGGTFYNRDQLKSLRATANTLGLKIHLDGARLYNALLESNISQSEMGTYADTISLCLSKGLGAPVGSVLMGTQEQIDYARRLRKVFGGGMRQAGMMAAAGIYVLENHIDRLEKDHHHARLLGEALGQCTWVKDLNKISTNIILITTEENQAQSVVQALAEQGILCLNIGPSRIRLVTHLDISAQDVENSIEVFSRLSAA